MAGDSGRHGHRRLALVVGLLLLAVWAGWLAASLVAAAGDVRAGTDTMRRAWSGADPADVAAGRPLPDLHRARLLFARARRRVTGPIWAPVRLLPVAGRQLRSVTALASAARDVSGVTEGAVQDARRLLDSNRSGRTPRIALIRALGELSERTVRRLALVRLGPRHALFSPLSRQRNELADWIDGLRAGLQKGAVAARAGADFLSGPRRYLVFAANNAEMRAGSGMFLSAGELETRDGDMRLDGMTSVTEIPVPEAGASVSGDLGDRWGWLRPNEDWRNLMLSPRFDASAQLAAQMWAAAGRAPVDGVLVLDPVVVQALLEATGSITVNGREIAADGVVDLLLYEQYLELPEDEQVAQRREQLGAIAQAAFTAYETGPVSLPELAGGLAHAARGRHLLAWSSRPDEQAAWSAVGIDGSLDADSLLLSVLNRGGNKLDWFLRVTADISFAAAGRDTACVVRLNLENRAPPEQPVQVSGPYPGSGVGEGVYLGIVAATLPGSAKEGRIDGVDQLAVAGRDGPTRVVGFQLAVPPGESRTVVVRFLLEGHRGRLTVEPSARVPAVKWSSYGRRWTDEESRRLSWQTRAMDG